ncbi:LOW QUALITY PROTEIN: hypothetical protein YC2023_076486 [Brassica napus]
MRDKATPIEFVLPPTFRSGNQLPNSDESLRRHITLVEKVLQNLSEKVLDPVRQPEATVEKRVPVDTETDSAAPRTSLGGGSVATREEGRRSKENESGGSGGSGGFGDETPAKGYARAVNGGGSGSGLDEGANRASTIIFKEERKRRKKEDVLVGGREVQPTVRAEEAKPNHPWRALSAYLCSELKRNVISQTNKLHLHKEILDFKGQKMTKNLRWNDYLLKEQGTEERLGCLFFRTRVIRRVKPIPNHYKKTQNILTDIPTEEKFELLSFVDG